MRRRLDLPLFKIAAEVATMLIVRHEIEGDADAIERLAESMETFETKLPFHQLTISELRMRAEHMRGEAG